MSELKKLREKHDKEIQELQDNCSHTDSYPMSVCVEEGIWGEAEFCRVCGKQLYWIDDPKRTHEVEHIPVEWI
jgi:hypothetical protein